MTKEILLLFGCLILIIWIVIGSVVGIIVVSQIIQECRQKGKNITSQSIFGMSYGPDGHNGGEGTSFISLYLFPFFFSVAAWPLLIFGK